MAGSIAAFTYYYLCYLYTAGAGLLLHRTGAAVQGAEGSCCLPRGDQMLSVMGTEIQASASNCGLLRWVEGEARVTVQSKSWTPAAISATVTGTASLLAPRKGAAYLGRC